MVIARGLSPADIDFQGKHAGEHFQFQFHQHWIRMGWPILKMLLWNSIILSIGYVMFVLIGVHDAEMRRSLLMILTVFFLLSQFELLVRFYRYLLYVVIVTDKKIHRIKKTLLTTDDHISMDLWMVQDIHKSQKGILQNILGYGTIEVEAQETIMRVHFVPRVGEKYEKILHLREEARGRGKYYPRAIEKEE